MRIGIVFGIMLLGVVASFAIPYPGFTACGEYGGEYSQDTNTCVLKNGAKCCPMDCDESGLVECSEIVNVECKELGETPMVITGCCDGLIVEMKKQYYTQECGFNAPTGGYTGVCIACGDGICDSKYESKCNCPIDCGGEAGYTECFEYAFSSYYPEHELCVITKGGEESIRCYPTQNPKDNKFKKCSEYELEKREFSENKKNDEPEVKNPEPQEVEIKDDNLVYLIVGIVVLIVLAIGVRQFLIEEKSK